MYRYQSTFHALGSEVFFTIVSDMNSVYSDWLLSKLRAVVVEFEQQFSRFLKDSELTRFNLNVGSKTTITEPFRELLVESKKLSQETKGLYNPFILPSLQQAGYKGSWPNPDEAVSEINFENRSFSRIEALVIGDTWAKIPINTALDFGGIGKGYLLDKLSQILNEQHLIGYWLSLGGDIICSGYDLNKKAWSIGIQSALISTNIIKNVANKRGDTLAIATSGVTKRKGTGWHHIIDPRTGKPSKTNILTATITSSSATIADVYAKVMVILGSDESKVFLGNDELKSCLLQLKNGESISW